MGSKYQLILKMSGDFMRGHNRKTHGFLIFVFMATPIIALTVGQTGKGPTVSKEQTVRQRELPIVDFNAPQPTDAKMLAKRQARANRYDRHSSQRIEEAPWISGRIWTTHWYSGLSALPITDSDTVIIGRVTHAEAHLSNDKTSIYSEFNIQLEEVLKDGPNPSISVSGTVSAERLGGAVRFPSGSIQRYETRGQGMPRVGGRYLLFLKRLDQEPNFSIITGYDLSGPTVSPLDGSEVEEGTESYPFDKYRGFDGPTFLELVRAALAKNA